MNSTKFSQAKPIFKNPFSNSYNQYYQYSLDIQRNTAMLKHRFPLQEISKIKSLLQQLDNCVDMVVEILQQESAKQIPIKKQINQPQLSSNQENSILKSAFLRCYKKMMTVQKANLQKDSEIQKLKREVQYYKNYCQMLMKRQQQRNEYNHNTDIY